MLKSQVVMGLVAGAVFGLAGVAEAGTIRAAVGAVSSVGEFDASTDIGNTIDQSGLSLGYVSGVTDFDTYIGAGPMHSLSFFDNEWFTPVGVHAAALTYDLGAIYDVRRLAMWNEDACGISSMSVHTSTDGVSYSLVGAFFPTDNVNGVDYPAEVFALAPSSARFIRLDVTGPQDPSLFDGIALGEVAFDTVAVPLPSAAWMGLGLLGGVGIAARRRRRQSSATTL